MNRPKRQSISIYLILGVVCILLSLLAWGIGFAQYFGLSAQRPFQEMASLGDSLGGITAPFLNIAGFLMLYAAFRQQHQSMQTSQEEFGLQRFESTFFQLLQMHYQNLSNIRSQYAKHAQTDFFAHCREFLGRYTDQPEQLDNLQQTYQKLYQEHRHLIEHFVRHLGFLLQSVQTSSAFDHLPPSEQKVERQQYADILQNQLSPDESLLLFYHLLLGPPATVSPYLPLLKQFAWYAGPAPLWLLHPLHWEWMQKRMV